MEPPPPPTPEADKFRVPKGPASRPRTSQQQQQQQQQQSGAGSNVTDVGSSHSFSSSSTKVSTSSSTSRISVSSTSSQATAEGSRSSYTVSQHTTTTTTTNTNGAAVQNYQKPTASQFQFDQTQQMTQTQIIEVSDELPDDEVESPLLFGILEGRDKTMHQSLYSHEAPYTFGTSDDCHVKISHAHWPDDKKTKEPWFRLTCVLASGSGATKQVVATVHDLSSSGLYIDGRKIGKSKRHVLTWGNQIAGGPPGNELFLYTYKLPKDERRIIETERTRYELENEEMGHGMYSKVYKARDLQHDGYYACKVANRLSREYSDVELRSMQNEIELLKNLRHVNIVKFEDVCTLGPTTYMFTELIEGVTLHTYYNNCDPFMTERDARHIFKQVCDAVNYLHMKNVVHRDIKSENVMIGPEKVVKLIDFGLARESSDSETMLHTFCGTPSYMAPETASNGDEKNAYGPPVDVWALGVMLFRMLTGRYPFDMKTYADRVAAGKCKAESPEAEGVAKMKAESGVNAGPSKTEVVAKKESDVEIKAEPVEAMSIPKETSSEETDMVGVERRVEKIVYDKRKPSYVQNWRPIVDIQIERSTLVKELLNNMLKIDPSRRIRIQHVLRVDWICMSDEELEKIDERFSQRLMAGVLKTPVKDDSEFESVWGMLEIVPGSVPDAPRRIGLSQEQVWMGRAPEKVAVYLGRSNILSGQHCVISKTPEGIMVGDASTNGTYINSFKIGLGRASQVFDGDVLGLVVPPDPTRFDEDLRDRNNRYLKYTVRIFRAPAVTPDQLVRRQYVSASGIHGAPSRPNVRKLDIPELPETGDWPPDDHAWAMLAPVNKNTAVERLCTVTVIVGRYIDCDIIVPSPLISRYHCKFEWDVENCAAYVTNMGQNNVKINGSGFSGHVQLRENDVVHLFSAASYDESDWLGYTFHYLADVHLPRQKRIKEQE